MAGKRSRIPKYGTVEIKGHAYYRTTITDSEGKQRALYSLDFHVTPHQLRHTYITNLLYMGVDPKTVQYLAGHKNSKTTMDIYAKIKYNKPQELLPVVNAALRPVAMS